MTTTINKIDDNSVERITEIREVFTKDQLEKMKESSLGQTENLDNMLLLFKD